MQWSEGSLGTLIVMVIG